MNTSGDLVLVGGTEGKAKIYSISQRSIIQEFGAGSGAITDTIWVGDRAVLATSTGEVKLFENGSEIAHFTGHAGEVTAIAIHPSGDILASVGVDRSYIFYDLTSFSQATQVVTDSSKSLNRLKYFQVSLNLLLALTTAEFHPDGHLFAAGGIDGQIKVFDVKTGSNAANFDSTGPVQAISFSENGTWLASVTKGSTSVSIWDLRKSTEIHIIDIASPVAAVRWDYTGQFLAIAGPSGLVIQQYSKSTKQWSEPLRSATPAVAVEWGVRAHQIISLNSDGIATILAPP